MVKEVGGKITEEECKTLILKKLYDLIAEELKRYLNSEKRELIAALENFWDKYAVSSKQLENERKQTLDKLNDFLSELGYIK